MAPSQSAELMRQMHPHRLRFAMFSDQNPMMQPVNSLAQSIRAERKPVAPDNPLLALEAGRLQLDHDLVGRIQAGARCRDRGDIPGRLRLPAVAGHGGTRDRACPDRATHGSRPGARGGRSQDAGGLEQRFDVGGIKQAAIRGALYVALPERSVDERAFAMLQAIRATLPANERVTLAEFKLLLKEQFLLLRLDEERAVRAIPGLLPDDADVRRAGLEALRQMVASRGALPEEGARRLRRVEGLFGARAGTRPLRAVNAYRRRHPRGVGETQLEVSQCKAATRRLIMRRASWHLRFNCSARRLRPAGTKSTSACSRRRRRLPALKVAVAHPCDAASLGAALEAAALGIIDPILVGPRPKIAAAAAGLEADLAGVRIVDAPHSHAAAAEAVALVKAGEAEA